MHDEEGAEMKFRLALLKGLWIWGLATWLYVVLTVLDPVTTRSQMYNLSAYVPLPTDLVGVVAFVVSFVCFVLWEWLR